MENQALTRLVHAPDPAFVVDDSAHAVTLCPEYGRYPYECWVLPKEPVAAPDEMSDDALLDFARALKQAQLRLDRFFGGKTPLVMWCALPPKGFEASWPFHIQLWPMQRGENKFKFLASVEQITGVYLVDVLPEEAAEQLRAVTL
jgi:UDPglucose--hexose-1-phosphate uridylyltransferase